MDINRTKEVLNKFKPTFTRGDVPAILNELFAAPVIAELGVFQGSGLELLLRTNASLIIGVDLWKNDGKVGTTDGLPDHIMQEYYEAVLKKFINEPRIKIIRDTTINAAALFPDNYFDYVFIDADHSYETCLNDMKAWYPKVKDGGILSGHDYFEHTSAYKFGVIKAVTEFVAAHPQIDEVFITKEEFAPSWFLVKVPI